MSDLLDVQAMSCISLACNVQTASVRGFTKHLLGSLCGADVKEAAHNLLNATHLQQLAPRTVVTFLGSHIPSSGDVVAQQGLQSLLDAAASSLALPNVLHKVGARPLGACWVDSQHLLRASLQPQ